MAAAARVVEGTLRIDGNVDEEAEDCRLTSREVVAAMDEDDEDGIVRPLKVTNAFCELQERFSEENEDMMAGMLSGMSNAANPCRSRRGMAKPIVTSCS